MVVQVKPGGNLEDATAKNIFDRIGKKVHGEAKKNAEKYRSQLKGSLLKAKFEEAPNDQQTPGNTCELKYQWHTNATNGKSYPCRAGKEERFSQVHGGECANSKIKGNKGSKENSEGACAPYRRLHLCVRNLENINRYDKINNDTLLADVCLAALHEGVLISADHARYKETNNDVNANICTMLARSFADIGDIIRGKDLYLGDKGNDKLEKNLKTIFGKIHNGLDGEAKKHYENDTANYYQLREDWWYINRKDVWKAIRCSAPTDADYFIKNTCSDGKSSAEQKCRCINYDVPTYFDYVPQYLRWFEEWGEEFCRLRKHKLQNAIKNCRGDSEGGKKLYCDLNGFDCTKTAKGKNQLVEGEGCKKCTVPCDNFVHWIDNQKQEFEKQKNKYDKEIVKAKNTIQVSNGNISNIYEKDFYINLKEHYNDVKYFLEKLSKGKICEGHPPVKNKTSINFKDDQPEDIFSHTEYCQACPWCGTKEKAGGKWEPIDDRECAHKNENKFNNGITTPISILSTDRGKTKILEKLGGFCRNGENIKKDDWKCHYDNKNKDNESGDSNICVLQNDNIGKKEEKSMPYHPFFWKWVTEMLIDSMYWRKELKRCTNNQLTKCKNKKCNNDCKCYEKWVKQKQVEWKQMEKHFKTQDGFDDFGYDFALKTLLNVEDILTNIKDTYGNVEEIKDINRMLENENNQEKAAVAGTGQKNTIDLLIDHEQKEAQSCLQKDTCPPPPATPETPAGEPSHNDDHHDDVHDDEITPCDLKIEVDDLDRKDPEVAEETVNGQSETPAPELPGPPAVSVDVCSIVDDLFSNNTALQEACGLKYGGNNSRLGWKCVTPSDTKSVATGSEGSGEAKSRQRRDTDSPTTSGAATGGSICIPPRRRRLYVGKLEEWATNTQATEARGSETPSQPNSHPTPETTKETPEASLRRAFVESAAVETFFLWHRYKKENTKKTQGGVLPLLTTLASGSGDGDSNDPQTQLQSGTIPNDFLRLMFYTLGDYRDILVRGGGDTNSGSEKEGGGSNSDRNIVLLASGSTEEEKQKMEAIQKKITDMLNKTNSGSKPSEKKREEWWNNNAKYIWEGMLCALTYNTDTASGQTPKHIEKVKEALWDEEGKKPKKDEYQYKTVEIKEENSETQPKVGTSQHPETTKLKDFVEIPTYFRWLEEWGEEFCRKRKHKLEEIDKECAQDGKKKCSGDGLKCKEKVPDNKEIFGDFLCSTCARHCRKYRKWIERKKYEFTEQYNAYTKQKENCEMETTVAEVNNHDNGFCTKLKETYTDVPKFLERLKNGPCKKDDDNNDNGEDEIDFKEKVSETFKYEKYCGTCSKFKIKCNGSDCTGDPKKKCDGKKTIEAKEIENMKKNTKEVTMLVSDISKNGVEVDDLKDCKNAGIFKGIREDKWKCGEYCGVDICTLKKNNNEKEVHEHIIMKEFLKRWLEYFFEDYNRIQKKLKPCIENGNGNEDKCFNGCKENCECVGQWIEKKKKEWENINATYIQEYTRNNDVTSNDLNSFLETLLPQIPVVTDKGKHDSLKKLEKSLGCNCVENSKSEDSKKSDVIDCMIKKLEDKIKKCQEHQNSGSPQQPCQEPPAHVEDEDDTLDEETEVKRPEICKDVVQIETAEEKEDGTCDAADEKVDQTVAKNEENNIPPMEPTPAPPPPTPALPPAPPSTPKLPKPPKPRIPRRAEDPLVIPSLVTSTLAWSVGIGFATFTYFYLKKKTKSTIDLLRVINIPKSDYDIPTKLSPNRYIPYTSGKYRGKRYIYLEGDSGTDSGYTDHYSDITSSSESEYEELDINDIYVPGSPKYKTLIEVVLEPSGKLSGNTIPTSGKNTPSDTQNDIQNDGIPSSKITDNEWNTLKDEFISQYLQSEQPNDVPNDYTSGNSSTNTNITTMSRDNMEEKPFITSIQDRDLYTGEEIKYNINMSTNSMDDIPINRDNNVYSGIDLINDALNGDYDIYNEMLKRKENELFGTNHPKHTNTHNVAKPARDDPIHNQLNLFHKWLDRHRDMCEKWENHHERLAKLKEEWENETHSGNKHSDIPSGKLSDTPSDNNIHSDIHPSDIPSGKLSDIPSSNKTLNTDVSIQIHMDNPKSINQFTNMDSILEDLDKYKEPYYDVQDDIYYDVNDHDTSTVDTNAMDIPSKVQIEMDVNTKLVKEKYPIADVWDI
ncbi:PfEMP1 [Plasmodium falciparum Dd2]|uniref:PfEMP1 n=2 Tax=Plasmodium falciparum TaxID=5833 RepID=A0A0L7LY89_PLAF4|nr:PfEMP1 [Plasmodium falciparum Dd2]